MTEAIRRSGELPLDFAFGAAPRGAEAAAEFRLADLRRTARPRSRARDLALRPGVTRYVHWRESVARIGEV